MESFEGSKLVFLFLGTFPTRERPVGAAAPVSFELAVFKPERLALLTRKRASKKKKRRLRMWWPGGGGRSTFGVAPATTPFRSRRFRLEARNSRSSPSPALSARPVGSLWMRVPSSSGPACLSVLFVSFLGCWIAFAFAVTRHAPVTACCSGRRRARRGQIRVLFL